MTTVHSRSVTPATIPVLSPSRAGESLQRQKWRSRGGELFPFFKCYRSAHLAVVGLQHLLYFLIPLVIFVVRLGHHLIVLQLLLQLLLPVCCLGLCSEPLHIWANCHFKAKPLHNKTQNWLDADGQSVTLQDFLTGLVLWPLYWPFGSTTKWNVLKISNLTTKNKLNKIWSV